MLCCQDPQYSCLIIHIYEDDKNLPKYARYVGNFIISMDAFRWFILMTSEQEYNNKYTVFNIHTNLPLQQVPIVLYPDPFSPVRSLLLQFLHCLLACST